MAVSMPLTRRTSSMSTLQTAPLLFSSPASSSHAPTILPDPLRRITNVTRQSEGPNTRLALATPSHPDQPLIIPALSPPASVYPSLSPVQVKREETPISLQTLRQSQSLRRVNKELRTPSPSLLYSAAPVGPYHQLRSPPCLQSLSNQPQQPPSPTGSPLSPSSPVMSSPVWSNKEVLKLLLPLQYDGKTVVECNQFIFQLLIYWQVVLSLLDGDACTWATPIFAQLVSVAVRVQGAITPFADIKAFLTVFKGRFGNLLDDASAQVKLNKLCTDKSMCERCTATEFSVLFKGLVDRSGYSDLELHNKYLSGIPSHVYRRIELEMFAMWEATEKHATEVEQQLDISRCHDLARCLAVF
ncbi:hypothetical protein IEO21_10098 [Rhodonia placenta]|uniref:Retrotransposon gag domain-containing protein n=1 Tax=Rhodonia placenta TaxID=104341 RepID=A0A8H7NT59_9APHY|nr:hypothetical protein IEO21_10098 [Postia placenta]